MSLENNRERHPLIDTLVTIKGNPRIAIYTEPLWVIPFNLYSPFVAVYMAALALSDMQIGLIASIFMFFRAVSALFSGAITDKLGRKLTTFIFDMASWSIPCLLWALSQNFWWFVVAASFNGLMQITDNSWTCLLIEDAEKRSLVRIFSLLHMIAQLAVIFAPLAAILVNQLSIIPAMRILFMFSFISMTIKFFLLYFLGDETRVGKTRMEETKDMSIWQIMGGYGGIFKKIFASSDMILALVLTTIFSIVWMVTGSFFGLYVTGTLDIPEYFLAYFPILRALVIAAFLYLIQPKLEKFGFRMPMLIGLVLFIAGLIMLILTPVGSLPILFSVVFLDAVAFSFVVPRNDSLIQILIEPSERARIRGLMMVVVLGFSIPFGYLAGFLSEINRRLPFAMVAAILVLMFVIIAVSKKKFDAISKRVSEDETP